MKVHHIPFQETGYFSNLIADYLDRSPKLSQFYGNFPDMEGFKNQLVSKQSSFEKTSRNTLVKALIKQYNNFNASDLTENNINSLAAENTFTITTGHQLNIFTGPLYFLYKIISTINLCNIITEIFTINLINIIPQPSTNPM